eukprot:scaffold652746_cov57-Prasinocladus_malaysianus.AAC.1
MHTEGIICLVLGIVLGFPAVVHFAVERCDAQRQRRYEPYRADGPPSAGPVPSMSNPSGTQRVPLDSEPITPHAYVTSKDSVNGTPSDNRKHHTWRLGCDMQSSIFKS